MKIVMKQFNTTQRKVSSLYRSCQSTLVDYSTLAERVDDIEEENLQLSRALVSVQKELSMITDATVIFFDEKAMCFSFETKYN